MGNLVICGDPESNVCFAEDRMFEAGQLGLLEEAKKLLATGAPIDACFRGACQGNSLEIIRWCIENGASDLENGMVVASRYGAAEAFEFCLLKLIENEESTDFFDFAKALKESAGAGSLPMVSACLRYGTLVTSDKNAAFRTACFRGHLDVAKYLEANG